MTKEIAAAIEKKRLEVADEYRAEGYHVTLSPSSKQLPAFLRPFQLEMIASRHQNNGSNQKPSNVVVEVRNRRSLTQSPALNKIAKVIEAKPDWGFDLVVTNAVGDDFWQYHDQYTINGDDIRYRLQEAHQLSKQEHGEAALLLTWSTLEALLRRDVQAKDVPLEKAYQDNPLHLIKSLFAYGLLDQKQYQILKSGIQAQQRIAHGYREKQPISELLSQLLGVAEQLFEEPIGI